MKKFRELRRDCGFVNRSRTLKKLWKMTRLTTLLILLGMGQVFALGSYAQSTTLSLNFKNANLEEVLAEIEDQSEFFFLYNKDLINVEQKVDVEVQNKKINEILDKLFEGKEIRYFLFDRQIVLSNQYGETGISGQEDITVQQQRAVSGTVTDEGGQPLPGVTVAVKGTTQGTITNADGEYILEDVPDNATLQFSFVGMLTQEVEVGNQTKINISMTEDVVGLEEVVVLGYSVESKRTMASATTVLQNEELVGRSVTDTRQALQGKIAGVKVVNNGGDPGAGTKIVIRGIGSFSNTDPLYVIDGIQGGDINTIPPQNIESITILKDASTTAIYGSAAANGVVIVTTKSGKLGKVRVSYDGGVGVDIITQRLDLLNAKEYVDVVKDIQETNGQTLTTKLMSSDVLVDRTDWQDVMFQPGLSTEHNLSLSGGSETATYAISGGYLSKESTVIDQDFQRMTLNAKFTQDLFGRKIRLTQNVRMKNDITDGVTAGFNNGVRMPPYVPLYDETVLGGYGRADKVTDLNDANNPAAEVYRTDYQKKEYYTDVDFSAEVNLIQGLRFKTQGRFSFWNSNDHTFNYPLNGGNFARNEADMSENFVTGSDFILENFFSYSTNFGDHEISATLGNTYDPSGKLRTISALGSSFTSTSVQNISLANSKSIGGAYVNSQSSRLSYYGRLSYTYAGKYIFNGSVRRDASSKFGINNRWGTFYGVGLAWAISEEDFFSVPVISDLKLRASYGKLGNDNIPLFQGVQSVWRGEVNNIVYSFGDTETFYNGSTVNSVPNSDLKWEETQQLDIGVDISLMRNSLSIVVDYFRRNNQDLLIETLQPLSTGTGWPNNQGTKWVNAASMINSGFEIEASYGQSKGDFSWNVAFNTTYSVNEVTALGTIGDLPILGGEINTALGEVTRTDIGHPIASFYGYIYDHVAVSQAEVDALNAASPKDEYMTGLNPGDRVWKDVDGNGYIDGDDRTWMGNPSPKWQYGLTFNTTYKGFDMQAVLFGVAGVEIFNANLYWWQGMTKPFNQLATVLDRWKQDGDITDIPRAGQNSTNNVISNSSYVESGDYLKIQNLSLGYTLPSSLPWNIFEKARIYVNAQNVFTFTKYSGFDPEVSSADPDAERSSIFMNGVDYYQHPNPRIYRLGLQLNF
jgi:TonB-linked SusC/RagA family outer membrane protein